MPLKRRLYASAAALGLALGSMGVAAAASGGSSSERATDPVEATTDAAEPAYTGSVEAPPEDETLTEAEEAASLEPLAGITADDAAAAATAAVPGEAGQVELDNENGYVVYSVEVTDPSGASIDVKVDAGNGTVLDQQADDDDSGPEDPDEDDGADVADDDDDDVEHENEHDGPNDPDEGHED